MDGVARALCKPFEDSRPDLGIERRLDAIAETDRSYAELLLSAACTDAHRRPELQALVDSPALRSRVEMAMKAPLGATTVRLRANVPSLPHRRQPWHSDVARNDGSPCARIRLTAWIPLSDVHSDNGTLEVAEGLRDGPVPHDNSSGRFLIPDELVGDRRHVIVCGAGSAVLLDRYTPHRAVPNRSTDARWSLVVWIKAAPPETTCRDRHAG